MHINHKVKVKSVWWIRIINTINGDNVSYLWKKVYVSFVQYQCITLINRSI